jgi:acetylornithine deacetylase/succinyl-diaminopimelate desuccinylase-like protein
MISPEILRVIDKHRQRYINELLDFLTIPSVSTYSHHAREIEKAAAWVLQQLQHLGFDARIYGTQRHPVVFGEGFWARDRPTLLIYGHYDVQPAEPLEEWLTPPFVPNIRDGSVYARGATDDKGQFFTYLKALEAVLSVEKALPLNVKILVEGEEEIGSPSMAAFLQDHRRELAADFVALSDGSQFARGIPAITYGLRGLAYLQVDLQGPRFDLHSGGFGGLIANPIQILAEILAKLKHPDGRIAIPGFYDKVEELQPWERNEMASLPFDEDGLKAYLGVRQLVGEPGYSVMERKSARPTLDVNGIWGGFSGEGAKTIIPAKAGAKVSMRLVPRQQPEKINRLFRDFVATLTPPDMKLDITDLYGSDPVLVAREEPCVQAAARAIEIGFGKAPVFIREGGSIPIVNLLKESLGLEKILLLGWGSPDDGAHSPNERFCLEDFHRGIRSVAALFYELTAG